MPTWTDYQRVDTWIKETTGLDEFRLVGITTEISKGYIGYDGDESIVTLWEVCSELFTASDVASSFQIPLVYILLETPTSAFFKVLHTHLASLSCDRSNIHIIVPLSLGIDTWWQQYQQIELINSYKIHSVVDFPFSESYLNAWYTWFTDHKLIKHQVYWGRGDWYSNYTPINQHYAHLARQNNITKYFTYLGGTSSNSFEFGALKQYAVLRFKMFIGPANIDFLGSFWPRVKLTDYVDRICDWKNHGEVQLINSSYMYSVNSNTDRLRFVEQTQPEYENFTAWQGIWSDNQTRLQESFACVVRESLLEQPYSAVSEKTITAFLSRNLVIPMEYCGVERLEQIGFKFDHSVFDYQYQYEPSAQKRIVKIFEGLTDLSRRYDIVELNQLYRENEKLYQHNADRAQKLLTGKDPELC